MDAAVATPWQRYWHPWGWLLVLLAVVTALPEVDFRISGLFFDPKFGFIGGQYPLAEFVRKSVPRIIIGASLAFAMATFALRSLGQATDVTPRKLGFLLATLLIGPGLIVESILKPNWGRARPDEVVEFGGMLHYTPPLWISDACSHNCSFVSGHAAVAFWMTAYAFLVPPRYYRLAIAAGLVFGAAVGMVRVMQGAHFFSDIVYAGAIVTAVNAIGARLILQRA